MKNLLIYTLLCAFLIGCFVYFVCGPYIDLQRAEIKHVLSQMEVK